jgi:hypothetical protein
MRITCTLLGSSEKGICNLTCLKQDHHQEESESYLKGSSKRMNFKHSSINTFVIERKAILQAGTMTCRQYDPLSNASSSSNAGSGNNADRALQIIYSSKPTS